MFNILALVTMNAKKVRTLELIGLENIGLTIRMRKQHIGKEWPNTHYFAKDGTAFSGEIILIRFA
jgi:hypothetical protein